ncbi:hypothetical protein J4G08_19125 [Candidatus Poribacteria bacterium]|nr:hypothetical protein [Candidatus Poribacteria bacterium]
MGNSISRDIVQNDLETGYHRNPTENLEFFTDAYLHRPDELRSELVESYWADPDQRAIVLDFIRKVESDPSILGMSARILAIGTK